MKVLSDLGEKRIIDIIKRTTKNSSLSVDKITDDVAIMDIGSRYLLFKIEASFEEYDFPPFAKPEEVAQTALAIAVSDFAAKGERPLAIVTSLELPMHMKAAYFTRLSNGLDYFARKYGAEIVGGDVSESNRLAITPAIVGFGKKGHTMMRKGAKRGNVVAIADYIGDYVAGYTALKNGIKMSRETKAYLKKKMLSIEPQLHVGWQIADTGRITSTIDLNDGLEKCSKEIAELNDVDIVLYGNKLPISHCAREVAGKLGIKPESFALSFGGDLNIMMTFEPKYFEIVKKAVKRGGKRLFKIGEVRSGSGDVLIGEEQNGSVYETRLLEKSSYEHFVTGPLYKERLWRKVLI